MTYELVLLAALLFVAAALFVFAIGDARTQPVRAVFQGYLLLVAGGYFVWNWTGGRRTLPMRTWRMCLVDRRGSRLNPQRALIRFLAALVGYGAGGLSVLWALLDPERQFLHDRIAGTRLANDSGSK